MDSLLRFRRARPHNPPFVAETVRQNNGGPAAVNLLPGWTQDDLEVHPTCTPSVSMDGLARDTQHT